MAGGACVQSPGWEQPRHALKAAKRKEKKRNGSEAKVNEGGVAEVALRFSPVASRDPSSKARYLAGDGGVVFDASAGWATPAGALVPASPGEGTTLALSTAFEAGVVHNAFRFFDGDMHYAEAGLNLLVKALQAGSTLERERFFSSTIGVRRRMDRKWQETPLAKVFTLSDEYAALKERAQAVFVREALGQRSLKLWEAFMAFDSDDNGLLGPAELYGALKWLEMPDLTPEDVVDFLEVPEPWPLSSSYFLSRIPLIVCDVTP